MQRTVVLLSDGELHREGNTLSFKGPGGKRFVPVENIHDILVFGEVQFNKRLLEFLSQKEILLHYFNHYGYYMGTIYPREHNNSGYMILKQAEYYLDEERRLVLARSFVNGAVQNIRRVLLYYKNRGKKVEHAMEQIDQLSAELVILDSIPTLMSLEGKIREIYYSSFDTILENSEFIFERRSRRPPHNELNALISFCNTLLYTAVLGEIYKTHLDPRIGYLHATNFRRFTLNLDIAEIFKPIIVDRLIFNMIGKRMLQKKHFSQETEGLYLKDTARRRVLEEFENRLRTTIRHPRLKRNVSYRRLIRMELYKLEKHLMGETEYTPFVAKW